ncbi:HEAT repeat domain-containing protein [Candidatus Woesearchaeota archaeon]|nr:HEAT repeat domain-containing protein [Candidatus Woesearchaeota archaeon]
MTQEVDALNDRQRPIEERLRNLYVASREKHEGITLALASRINDEQEELEVRLHAIKGLSWQPPREAFPYFLKLLVNPEENIREEAVASISGLKDSRALFPLVNRYRRLELQKKTGLPKEQEQYGILKTLEPIADPRAVEFLMPLATYPDENIRNIAANGVRSVWKNENMLYTFHGSEELRKDAEKNPTRERVIVRSREDFQGDAVRSILQGEKQGDLRFCIYVVLPDEKDTFGGRPELVLAPRRSEHYRAAAGKDGLAMGELGISKNGRICYADNHSGGYFPGTTSFAWLAKACDCREIPLDLVKFSALYPADGYFTRDFLSQQPLYEG